MSRSLIALGVLAATAALTLLSGGAYAAPTCTGTTLTVASGQNIPGSFLNGTGNCVIAGDKLFGNFIGVGGSGLANVSFTFLSLPFGNVTLGIADTIFGPTATPATLDYQVAITPEGLAAGFLIDDITKDFTLNRADADGPNAVATLTGHSDAAGFDISCTRGDPASPTDNCPITTTFTGLASMDVHEELTIGPNSIVTGITDTISQSIVPEPASLGLLGTGLLGLGLLARRRRR